MTASEVTLKFGDSTKVVPVNFWSISIEKERKILERIRTVEKQRAGSSQKDFDEVSLIEVV